MEFNVTLLYPTANAEVGECVPGTIHGEHGAFADWFQMGTLTIFDPCGQTCIRISNFPLCVVHPCIHLTWKYPRITWDDTWWVFSARSHHELGTVPQLPLASMGTSPRRTWDEIATKDLHRSHCRRWTALQLLKLLWRFFGHHCEVFSISGTARDFTSNRRCGATLAQHANEFLFFFSHVLTDWHWLYIIPRWSMYGIFTYIYPINHPHVGKYTIHGASGIGLFRISRSQQWSSDPMTSMLHLTHWSFWGRGSFGVPLLWRWLSWRGANLPIRWGRCFFFYLWYTLIYHIQYIYIYIYNYD